MAEGRKYRLNPEAEILWLDTSLKDRMYQLRLGDLRYRINENTLAFLRQFEETQDEEALDNALQGQHAGLKDFFVQKHVLITDAESPPQTTPSRKHPLALRLSLFSQRRLQPLTAPLAVLFSPALAPLAIVFIISSHAFFLYYSYPMLHAVPKLGQEQWIVAIIACYCLIFVHELGHSSACTRYGARHDDIGIGIYFIYPVFYANVTDCWRLPRYQRAVVDTAGLYFQLLGSGLCGILWVYTRQPILFVLVYSSLATALINLNPFLRFDGYWLLTDITALPSLQRSNQELWRYWLAKLRGKAQNVRTPEFFSAPVWVKTTFMLYSICSLSFFAFFFGRIAVLLVPYLIHEYPRMLALVWHMLISRQFNAALLATAFQLVALSATSFGVVMMLKGLSSRVLGLLLRPAGLYLRRFLGYEPGPKTHADRNEAAIPASTLE